MKIALSLAFAFLACYVSVTFGTDDLTDEDVEIIGDSLGLEDDDAPVRGRFRRDIDMENLEDSLNLEDDDAPIRSRFRRDIRWDRIFRSRDFERRQERRRFIFEQLLNRLETCVASRTDLGEIQLKALVSTIVQAWNCTVYPSFDTRSRN